MPDASQDLTGFLPVDVVSAPAGVLVRWCEVGDARFDEPFFAQTIQRLLAHGKPAQRLTSLDRLATCATSAPTAFIFHQGRCGSTLLSRMLGAPRGHRAVSEPPALGNLFVHRRRLGVPLAQAVAGMVGALSRGGADARVFIKLPSWCVLFYREIHAAFPDVPAFFAYRDPVDSLASLLAKPAPWLTSPPLVRDLFGDDPALDAGEGERAGYCLSRLLSAALAGIDHGLIPVAYPGLLTFALDELPERLGLGLDETERQAMGEIARRHAHDPDRAYVPHPGPAPDSLPTELGRRHTQALYRALQSRDSDGAGR